MVVCVECGREVLRLFRDYGNCNIRLKRCEHCGEIADKYIELDPVNILLEMLLLKEPVYRHSIFNRQDYAVNSADPLVGMSSSSPANLSPSSVFQQDNGGCRFSSGARGRKEDLSNWNELLFKPSQWALWRWDVVRSVLLMAASDIFVKLRFTPAVTYPAAFGLMAQIDYMLHKVLFSQVVNHSPSFMQSWSYAGIIVLATLELVCFLLAITLGVMVIRNRTIPSVTKLSAIDIAMAAGVSQVGKVAPVILIIWSSAPDIRLAVASFNLSTCVVVVKLTSGRKGFPALLVVLAAVALRLMIQWLIARLYYPMYPCSIISAFG